MSEVTTEVKSAVNAMASAFEEFKKTNDERLKQIEEKGSVDPMLEAKLTTIEAELDKYGSLNNEIAAAKAKDEAIEEKLASIETMLKRPGADVNAKQADTQLKSFETWLRKGEKGMDPEELKALTVGTADTAGNLAPAEYVGAIPVRQDITVLPADDPKNLRLGWVIYEEIGIIVINDYAIAKVNLTATS